MWAMTGCCGNVWDLLTSVNDPNHCIRMAYVDHPDVLCKPSGWYVYKRCLIFLEVVRKSVSCVLYRKIRMRVTRMTMHVMCHCKMRATCHCKMRATCHCKMRATCSRREGSLHLPLLEDAASSPGRWYENSAPKITKKTIAKWGSTNMPLFSRDHKCNEWIIDTWEMNEMK